MNFPARTTVASCQGNAANRFFISIAEIKSGIAAFIQKTDVDELMVTGQIFDHTARLRSFEIVAEVAMV